MDSRKVAQEIIEELYECIDGYYFSSDRQEVMTDSITRIIESNKGEENNG